METKSHEKAARDHLTVEQAKTYLTAHIANLQLVPEGTSGLPRLRGAMPFIGMASHRRNDEAERTGPRTAGEDDRGKALQTANPSLKLGPGNPANFVMPMPLS